MPVEQDLLLETNEQVLTEEEIFELENQNYIDYLMDSLHISFNEAKKLIRSNNAKEI